MISAVLSLIQFTQPAGYLLKYYPLYIFVFVT